VGSLYTAAASYLDARTHRGRWLIRIEDVDEPRVVPGSAAGMLQTLERFGFEWDGETVYQSSRTPRYAAAVSALRGRGLTFECSCSRSQLADADRYPGHCRARPRNPGAATATRVRVEPGFIEFTDRIHGKFRQDVAAAVGDFIIRRRDQLYAYVLAVVVDDAAQGVTHVVRGADLLDQTAAQIYLQRLLGLESPCYAHVPVLTEAGGRKLAKSLRSVRADAAPVIRQLIGIFELLSLAPPRELLDATPCEAWRWAIGRWQIMLTPQQFTLALNR
jgi:glutamyl-Q tRNA(Asp) synthetase